MAELAKSSDQFDIDALLIGGGDVPLSDVMKIRSLMLRSLVGLDGNPRHERDIDEIVIVGILPKNEKKSPSPRRRRKVRMRDVQGATIGQMHGKGQKRIRM